MKESFIEKKVCEYAKKQKWLVYKFTSPSNRGVPDRIFLKNNFIFFIEFKSKKNKISKIQDYIILNLKKNNFFVFIVDEILEGIEIINEMDYILNEKL